MEAQEKHKAVIIATQGTTTNLLYNELQKHWNISAVILENPVSKKKIIKGRLKKVGFFRMMDQLLFIGILQRLIGGSSRIKDILNTHQLSEKAIPTNLVQHIPSVNDQQLIQLIEEHQPQVIFVNGTRIISKNILDQVAIPMVNIHVGITPKYRGVHGGYWAMYYKDHAHFGVTVHLIDAGIDTGKVIAQKVITPSSKDNYKTYPILQSAYGIKLIVEQKSNINSSEISTVEPLTKESALHFHPGYHQYIFARLFKGVK